MILFLRKFWLDDSGATAVEYGIMAALIAGVIIGAVALVSGKVQALFTTTETAITGAGM